MDMSHELIYSWLNLPAGNWPPDHYTLLGLEPGADDVARIEEQVQERLEKVRHYQLTHPEQATEAMNRLAQALICLTDPPAKKAYDLLLFGKHFEAAPAAAAAASAPAPAPPTVSTPVRAARSVRLPSQAAQKTTPEEATTTKPGRATMPAQPVLQVLGQTPLPSAVPVNPPLALPAPPPPPRPERSSGTTPVVLLPAVALPVPVAAPTPQREKERAVDAEVARSSRARRGLGTKRALYQRIVRTRQLLHAWEQAGRFLAWPKKRLNKAADAAELVRVLAEIRSLLQGFPPLLGEAGQSGYLVLTLARQQAIVPTFQTLIGTQREALARDWWAGRDLLEAHRDYLRQEVRRMRHKRAWGWTVRAVGAFLTDQPGWILLFLALVALNVAVWRTFLP
jgi:hypothetical protein